MKKYILRICSIIFAILFLSNCNDEFLERHPLDEISDPAFWRSESDLKLYNNNLYVMTKQDHLDWGASGAIGINIGHTGAFNVSLWMMDCFSDNFGTTDPRIRHFVDVKRGYHQIPSTPRFYGYQRWDFIRAVNIGIDRTTKAEDIPQEVRNRYLAEQKFFRGWFYHHKVKYFGDVNYFDKELDVDSPELYGDRTPREEVMEKVLEDLNFAVEYLPYSWGDGGNPGRMNKWDALHIKSRICLFEGTWRKYHGGSNPDRWLEEAANAARRVIDDGPFSLYDNGDPYSSYNASHRMLDLTGNPEIIHFVKYERPNGHNSLDYFVKRGYPGGATKSFVEDYLCIDGLPITLSPLYQGDEVYENIFENRDPRLRQTILNPEDQEYYNYEVWSGGLNWTYPRVTGMAGGVQTTTGYHIIKMYNATTALAGWNQSEQPAITMRFAETLLNYAEAKAELGTITQADLNMTINRLRDRVAMPHMEIGNIPVDPRYENSGVSPLINEIRRERRVELFAEGFRYDDIRRWKQGRLLREPLLGMRWDEASRSRFDPDGSATVRTTTVDGVEYIDMYQGTDWANPVFEEDKHYLWPIPLSIISQVPDITQTPGW